MVKAHVVHVVKEEQLYNGDDVRLKHPVKEDKSDKSDKEEAKMNKWWVQTLITVITIVAGISVAWGNNAAKINGLENRVDSMKTDHDVLISLNTKMDIIMKDVHEVKDDLKRHIETTINPISK